MYLANPTPLLSWSVSLNILVDITLPYLLSNASNFWGCKYKACFTHATDIQVLWTYS